MLERDSCLESPEGQIRQHPSKQEASPVPFMAKTATGREKGKKKPQKPSAMKPEISQHRSSGCKHSRERPRLITRELPHSGPDPVPKWTVGCSPVFIFLKIKCAWTCIVWSKEVDHKEANKNSPSCSLPLAQVVPFTQALPDTADTECQLI